jgi:hypothetical protein
MRRPVEHPSRGIAAPVKRIAGTFEIISFLKGASCGPVSSFYKFITLK